MSIYEWNKLWNKLLKGLLRVGKGEPPVDNAITRNRKQLRGLCQCLKEDPRQSPPREHSEGVWFPPPTTEPPSPPPAPPSSLPRLCQCRERELERSSRFPAGFAEQTEAEYAEYALRFTKTASQSAEKPNEQDGVNPLQSLTLAELMQRSHEYAVEKGWWEEESRPFADQLANYHAEISEAWEEYRKHGMEPDKFIYHNYLPAAIHDDGYSHAQKIPKPEGIAVELADLLIRVADTCQRYNIPLERAIREKMAYNKTRPYRHGGKKA